MPIPAGQTGVARVRANMIASIDGMATSAGARAELREAGATVAGCGDEEFDWYLADRGLTQILCEGAQPCSVRCSTRDLVDELCVTVGPSITAGTGKHLTAGSNRCVRCEGAHVFTDEEEYRYLRWVRDQG